MVYADIDSQHSKPKRYTACLLAAHFVSPYLTLQNALQDWPYQLSLWLQTRLHLYSNGATWLQGT